MNISALGKSACILIASCFSFSATAATLDVVGGQLMGASGVGVGGSLYDVRFLDGTCIDLYDGCDENTDFTFQNATAAYAAAQALLDQVFIDDGGQFDSLPGLTNGIQYSSYNAKARIPYAIAGASVILDFAQNSVDNSHGDFVGTGPFQVSASQDTSDAGSHVYAVWSPTAVPAPAALVLFASAVAGMTGVRLTRQNKST